MQRPHIHIRTVLAEIELPDGSGQPRAFSIGYYKTNGTKGSKPAVRKGGLPFALKISLICHYNGRDVKHG